VSTARFDELIHAPTRLAIVSLLAAAQWADFKYIRDELGLSDSALSKQLSTLESAGYVEIRKGFVGKWPRTSASLSTAGRQAFEQHVAALQQIIARSQQDADAAPAAGDGHGIPGAELPDPLRRARAHSEPELVPRSASDNGKPKSAPGLVDPRRDPRRIRNRSALPVRADTPTRRLAIEATYDL
jgi:DNA-binding transcriptional ArsR family regulator